MDRGEFWRRRDHRQTTEHTREGPDVFPRASLSDGAGVDGGGHVAEGKDRRNKSEMEVRLYRVGEECISEVRDVLVI